MVNIYAIHPDHYKANIIKRDDSICIGLDDWYINDAFSYSHKIYSTWQCNFYYNGNAEKIYFPEHLKTFYNNIIDKHSATNVSILLDKLSTNDHHVQHFINWLNFWADKNAMFYVEYP